ncbi:membrane or secreted protein [Pseudopedobacter saltans DSM 12145]|uniref:Membrane or secreted protein n=1 Tax=Pseudopedobacter saltans (strain ATCC 51119 / DSM 12145 / JCM 21818 / CCUG 39354 / LMG 10337 / NBRC 100064 / NCIMB 13643) TaxID=762903 RepID=F0SAS8_PSESL|nr:cellulase family glycosylhydrolase [Pseudopedobacter saltans]ADY53699.1 membrane or secreted protein [Pseudopedobacter saltans DSM 12145]
MFRKFLMIALSLVLGISMADAQGNKGIYIDKAGKIRWEGTNKEAYFFGVNYSAPFVFGYRHIKAKGVNIEEAIRQDVYHLARLGINAYRIHVFDSEISDSLGNIKDNEHLRLFDFLIAELKKRNIKILLTPIAYWGNGYPEKDMPTGSFSFKYGKKEALVNKEAWKAQENYLTQFFQRINRYTGKSYQDDVDILATEINNEPHHSGAKELTTEYISLMVNAVRKTGWTKPIFYNISESPKYADAVVKSNVQGHSFQWYPSGLVAGRTQKGNFLPHVSKYNIPFDSIPGFNKRAKIVYEFDGADIADSYLYPAMARSFRNAGFQWATMFAYEPLAIADVNTEYQTHYLNLAYTPSKAISFMIANKQFRDGLQPVLSYDHNLSELLNDTLFYYSNSTAVPVPKRKPLKHIAGVGTSSIVAYEGNGAYFLDKLAEGVWRLEVMPDVINLTDPFGKASPKRKVNAIEWNTNHIKISLPDLGEAFAVKGINEGNNLVLQTESNSFLITPGTYLLQSPKAKEFKPQPSEKIGLLALNEFVAPKADEMDVFVNHQPERTLSVNSAKEIKASVFGVQPDDEVKVIFNHLSGIRKETIMVKRGAQYLAPIPQEVLKPGLLRYFIVVKSLKGNITFPGSLKASPYDWDFYSKDAYEVFINQPQSAITLFDAREDRDKLNYYNPDWENYGLSFVSTSENNKLAIRSIMKKSNNKDFMGWQTFIGDLVEDRAQDLDNFNSLVIKGNGSFKNMKAKIALISKEGNSYSSFFTLTDVISEIKVPLTDLNQEQMLLLPRAYPGFQPLFYQSGVNKNFSLKDIERLEVTFGYDMVAELVNKEVSMSISEISLK